MRSGTQSMSQCPSSPQTNPSLQRCPTKLPHLFWYALFQNHNRAPGDKMFREVGAAAGLHRGSKVFNLAARAFCGANFYDTKYGTSADVPVVGSEGQEWGRRWGMATYLSKALTIPFQAARRKLHGRPYGQWICDWGLQPRWAGGFLRSVRREGGNDETYIRTMHLIVPLALSFSQGV